MKKRKNPNAHMLTRRKVAGKRRFPSRERYIRLANAFQATDDQRIRGEIAQYVMSNVELLLKKNAGAFMSRYPTGDIDDIVQAGRLGVLRALEKWDVAKAAESGTGFLTYAAFWIFSSMQSYARSELRGPVQLPKDVNRPHGFAGLDEPMYSSDDSLTLQDVLAAPTLEVGMPETDVRNLRALADVVLTPRERDIVWRMMEGDTLENVGKTYGLTRERIRQLKVKALAKLKKIIVHQHPEFIPEGKLEAAV